MKTGYLLLILAALALGGGALAYRSMSGGQGVAQEGLGGELPAFESGAACETCSLRHQRLQRERGWSED